MMNVDVTIILMYKSPGFSNVSFESLLEEELKIKSINVVFIGDVNIDISKGTGEGLVQLFGRYGLVSKLPLDFPTTNRGSVIDVCFSDKHDCFATVYESYYSYHKPVLITWPTQFST